MEKRITESELILPSLYLMSINGGMITTSDLIQKLRDIMKPAGEDLQVSSGRSDDKFSQKVRYLRSHRAFENLGLAEYKGESGDGYFEITKAGEQYLKNNQRALPRT